jgi:hypothetical protein
VTSVSWAATSAPVTCLRLPLLADRDAADRVDTSQCRGLTLGLHEADRSLIVDHRVRVGHGANAGESTGHRRRCAGCNGLALFLAGFAKVDMDIEQAWCNHHPRRIQHQHAIGIAKVAADIPHHTAFEQQVGDLVTSTGRIDDPPTTNQDWLHHFSSPPPDAQSGDPPASR